MQSQNTLLNVKKKSSVKIEPSRSSHPHFFPSIRIAFTLHACPLEQPDVAFIPLAKQGLQESKQSLKKCRNPKTMLRTMDFLTSIKGEKNEQDANLVTEL